MNRRQVLEAELPDGFLRQLTTWMLGVYQTAPEVAERVVEGVEQRDLLPFVRRALVEQTLRLLGEKWGMKAEAHPSGGFWHHRRVEHGRIVITQNTSAEAESSLRYAEYKHRYSYGLFSEQELESTVAHADVGEGEQVYALLTHGREKGAYDKLGFALFRFPKQGLEDCWPGDFDLFDAFPDVVNRGVEKDVREEIADTAIPELLGQENVS